MIIRFLIIFLVFMIGLVLGVEWGRKIYKKRVYRVLDQEKYKFLREAIDKLEKEEK